MPHMQGGRIHHLFACVIMLLAGCVLAGCAGQPQRGRDVLAEASETEFGEAGFLCDDTVAVAKNSGVDYERLIDRCLARDKESMHTFFRLSKHAGFDAASGQGHAAVTGVLLRKLGDRFFGDCLSRESAAIQDSVREDLLYDLGYGNTDISLGRIGQKYPATFPRKWIDNKLIKYER